MIDHEKQSLRHRLQLLEEKNPLLALKVQSFSYFSFTPSEGIAFPDAIKQGMLFIYRSCSVATLKKVSHWLTVTDSKVVFVEKSVADIFAFLSDAASEALLKHPSCFYTLLEDWREELFLQMAWKGLFLERNFLTAFPTDEAFEHFRSQIDTYFDQAFLIASEYRDYGIQVAKNTYQNMQCITESRKGSALKLKKLPALICGAGPSIASQLELCRVFGSKGVIFAGGALLAAQDTVTPHLGALVDPDPPYERFKNFSFFELPIIYSLRLSHQILKLMHGWNMLAPSSGTSPLEDYFFTECGESMPSVASGWNVANFMATLAAEMECDPIILVGMDMCYDPGREYGVAVAGEEKKGEQVFKNFHGQDVLSRKDLLMGRRFFSELVTHYPKSTFINATAKGLSIEGMQHKHLEDVLKELSMDYDIHGLLYAQRMECPWMCNDTARFSAAKQRLCTSFETTLHLLRVMVQRLEKSYMYQKENPSKNCKGPMMALEETELEEEPVFQIFLQPLWQIWKWIVVRDHEKEGQTIEGKLQQLLFFQRVTREHQALFHQTCEYPSPKDAGF